MKIISRSVIVLALSFLAISSAMAQETCKRNIEAQGGFSLCVPEGWRVETKQGEKYKLLFGPAVEPFTANINVKDEVSSMQLTPYVASSIKAILSSPSMIGAGSIKLVGWTDFATSSGLAGNRLIFETEYKGLLLRTVQFYLEGGQNHKFVINGTCLVKDKDTFDNLFDRAAKSFREEK